MCSATKAYHQIKWVSNACLNCLICRHGYRICQSLLESFRSDFFLLYVDDVIKVIIIKKIYLLLLRNHSKLTGYTVIFDVLHESTSKRLLWCREIWFLSVDVKLQSSVLWKQLTDERDDAAWIRPRRLDFGFEISRDWDLIKLHHRKLFRIVCSFQWSVFFRIFGVDIVAFCSFIECEEDCVLICRFWKVIWTLLGEFFNVENVINSGKWVIMSLLLYCSWKL